MQHLPRIWGRPSRRCRIRSMPINRLLWKRPRILEDRSPHVSHGTKPLARRAQGRSFATTSFREPTSQHSPIMLQLSLQSYTTAWTAWKLTRILQSWGWGQRQSAVCTQLVGLLEVCTATTDWKETLSWDALFSDAWQERLVRSTLFATK